MNIQRVCHVKNDFDSIALGENFPSLSNNRDRICVLKANTKYFVSNGQDIEFLQKYGFYGKIINSDILSNFDINDDGNEICLFLSDIEVIFLLRVFQCIAVRDLESGQNIALGELWKSSVDEAGEPLLFSYVAYHYYRSFGWVVRPGLQFGSDYLLYIASPEHCHASYSVYVKKNWANRYEDCLDENELLNIVRVSHSVSKQVVICTVTVATDHEMISDVGIIDHCTVEECHVARFDPTELHSRSSAKQPA